MKKTIITYQPTDAVSTEKALLPPSDTDLTNEILGTFHKPDLGYTYERKLALYGNGQKLQVLKKNTAGTYINELEREYDISDDTKKVYVRLTQVGYGFFLDVIKTPPLGFSEGSHVVIPAITAGGTVIQIAEINIAEIESTDGMNTTQELNFIGAIDTRPGKQALASFRPGTYFTVWSDTNFNVHLAW